MCFAFKLAVDIAASMYSSDLWLVVYVMCVFVRFDMGLA